MINPIALFTMSPAIMAPVFFVTLAAVFIKTLFF
jgi:hypothetical protein